MIEALADEFDAVFAALRDLGGRFAELVAAEPPGELRREHLQELRPAILELLATHGELVTGAGVVTVPDLLTDAPRWLEWWWGAGRGAPEPLLVNLDPAAPDFYDYTTADWYAPPLDTLQPRMAGPFVDYACTNEYSITLTWPVAGLGVAAADVLVSNVERRVMPALVALDRPVALTNADGRIIASNSPALVPGQRLETGAGTGAPVRSWLLVEAT